MSALNAAIRAKRFTQVKLLLDIGADVNGRDLDKRTALMQLCFLEDEGKAAALAKIFINHGAKVGFKDKDGSTVLGLACKRGQEQMVSVLLEESGDFDLNSQDNEGNTALHYAAMSGNFVVLNLMINALKRFKLSVDILNKKGETALIIASKEGNYFCARILLSEGKASKEARDFVEFKTANEWGKTKESLRSASASPFFRAIQLPCRSEYLPIRGSMDNSTAKTSPLRPKTAPADLFTQTGERNHRENLRQLFRVYESHVSHAFRCGVKPRPIVRETSPSPPLSECTLDSERADEVCDLNSPSMSPSLRRFSIRRASSLAVNTYTAFRRASLATSTLGSTAGPRPLSRRGSQSLGLSGRRLSQSLPQVQRIRRGSMNVLSKITKVSNLKGSKDKPGVMNNSNSALSESKSPTPVVPDRLIARLQTLAEASDSEDEDGTPEVLQRSTPANLFREI